MHFRKLFGEPASIEHLHIQAGPHTITAADPLPADLTDVLQTIHAH